jgi:hypothetical protein
MLTREKLQTTIGYVKYRSRNEAMRIARKLDLSDTHSHEANGMTIHMPGTNHRKLNEELQKRGFEKTMVPGQGGTGGGMMGGGMMGGGMMGGMSDDNPMGQADETGMLLRDEPMPDTTEETMPTFGAADRVPEAPSGDADGTFFSDGVLTPDDDATTASGEPDMMRGEDVREPFDSMFGSGDPDDDGEMELY